MVTALLSSSRFLKYSSRRLFVNCCGLGDSHTASQPHSSLWSFPRTPALLLSVSGTQCAVLVKRECTAHPSQSSSSLSDTHIRMDLPS
ncbi:hypothetical protein NQZ68_017723 [Dissostichus eleginoides]|nr:hypothetical protein NQZ68_017723 [Dissostichus eleginoides]